MLDIGGGNGEFAVFMASKGWDVVLQDTISKVLDRNIDKKLQSTQKIVTVQYFGRQKGQEWELLTEAFLPENPTDNERFSGRFSFSKTGTWEVKAIASGKAWFNFRVWRKLNFCLWLEKL